MREMLAFSTDSGEVIVEIDPPSSTSGQGRVARRPADLAIETGRSLDSAVDAVRPAAMTMIEKLRTLPIQPDEISVEFGLKLSVSAGAIIAATAAEGNFVLRMTWTRARGVE